MDSLHDDDDVLGVIEDDVLGVIEDDGQAGAPGAAGHAWRLLVVDDDEEVHLTTAYALGDVEVFGRRFAISHAYSAAEAKTLLREDGDFAVILLDVVMETEDAGLRLVHVVRDELKLSAVRIILRTGQPGYAPELTVIRDYDINDYRTKSELTRTRLLASLHAALRAYVHIHALDASRRGLEQIIKASADLFRRHSLAAFCEGVLTQLGALLDMESSGIVIARTGEGAAGAEAGTIVLAAAGPYRHLSGTPLADLPDATVKAMLAEALERRASRFDPHATVLHIAGPSGDDLAVFLATGRDIGTFDRKLLEVFSSNVALGFDNVSLLDHVRSLAYFDPLTNLPNRAGFRDEIARRLDDLRRSAGEGALVIMLLDLDHFQSINDGLGYVAGDALLREVASQLTGIFGETGAVARIASDMFALLVPLARTSDETDMLEAIGLTFAGSFAAGDHAISVKASGGYALTHSGDADADVDTLLHRAGMALKRAKKNGRGRVLRFEAAMEEELRTRLALVNRISQARAGGQFSLVFQPQLRLSDLAVIGAEALMRWRTPEGAWIRPDVFIPAAEDGGHIIALGEWVLRQSCLKQVHWRAMGLGRLRIAVNVSVRQLRDADMVRTAERVLKACGAEPADIELEITESGAMEDGGVLDAVRALRDMGFSIAIDDFGTGYSSLSRLREVPASVLKIDRSFVTDLEARDTQRSIAAMIINVGHDLGLDVLAEGVETTAQEEVLRRLGCDSVQGYLFAKPLPADELEAWMVGRAVV